MAGNGQRGTVLLPRAEAFKGKPSGRITQPGLADLRGKRIAFIDDSRPNADVILAEFQSLMESRYGIHAVVVRKKSLGLRINQPLPKDVFEPLAAEVDAGLVALGSWGSCTSRSVRDAADFEDRGIPAVAIVAPAFERQARAYATAVSLPPSRVLVLPIGTASPDAAESIPRIKEAVAESFKDVEAALAEPVSKAVAWEPMAGDGTYNPFDVTLPLETADLGDVLGPSHREVLTDGLPVVKPTRVTIDAMLRRVARRPDDVVATLPPMMGQATTERLAAMAVLAGCPPPCFPALVAAVEAVAEDPFNLLAVQTTTGNVGVAMIVSGPAVLRMGFHPGSNGVGPGPRTNITTGRALRLVLMNVGGATPGLLDVSCIGWPGKLSFCVAEHQAASPWPPFHEDRGFAADASVVTVVATYGFIEMADAVSTSAPHLLANLSAMLGCSLASGSRGSQALALLTPQHAHILASGGYTRRRAQEELYERVRSVQPLSGATSDEEPRLADSADDVLLVVTGGNGGKSAYVPPWAGSRSVSVALA